MYSHALRDVAEGGRYHGKLWSPVQQPDRQHAGAGGGDPCGAAAGGVRIFRGERRGGTRHLQLFDPQESLQVGGLACERVDMK